MPHRIFRASSLAFIWAFLFLVSGSTAWAAAPPAAFQDPNVCTGSIGDFVWFDQNGDGLRQAAESTQGINGVVLELRDATGTVVATTTTGAGNGSIAGSYQFAFLCPGTYTISIVSGVPAGYVPTVGAPGADPTRDSSVSPVTVTLVRNPADGQVTKDPTIDFGFTAGCTGGIGDRVWNDINANGIQDAGEPGLAGVPVRLLLNGSQVAATTTDANGNYTFPGLCPGNYSVEVGTPSGFVASPTGGTADAALDSDASGVVVDLGPGENDPTIDFGFFAPCAGVIGDRVWFDSNRNGIQDGGELGIAGVTVELLDSNGAVVATAITDGIGRYEFTGLCGATYSVRVNATTLPASVEPSPTSPPAGGSADNDSNASPAEVLLGVNEIDLTIDFGYSAPCTGLIGDRVWSDINQNGIQDAGEPGIPNVRVILRDRADNSVLAVDVTDSNGLYQFEGLCNGDYIVEVDPTTLAPTVLPSPANQGSNDEADSDGVNHEALVTLPSFDTSDQSIDFGYFKASAKLQLVKLTNGTDNNSPTGPSVPVGGVVTWTYLVTNPGTEAVRDLAVIDDGGTPSSAADDFAPAFTGGDTDNDGLLDVGETWVYTAAGIAKAGQYVNVARATGTGVVSKTPVEGKDLDHYFGAGQPPTPGISIVKTANKDTVVFGEAVTFTYVVTNTGNVALTDVAIVDDNATPLYRPDDFSVGTVASLAAGQSVTFTATRVPPTKMCNYDWWGKLRKCGMLVIEDWFSHKKFTYLQAKDHRDDYDDYNGWSGRRSYSHKAKFRVVDRWNTLSQELVVDHQELEGDEEYVTAFTTSVDKSFVTGSDHSVSIPRIFHKKGWDSDWRFDWDRWFDNLSRWSHWDDDRWGRDNDKDYDYDKHPKPCTTTSTNVATVTAKYGTLVLKATDKATVQIVAPAPAAPYKTFTQGGWGAKPSGNNPGKFLSNNFASVYPNDLRIGGTKTIKLTSARAIERFLPQGGTPAKLTHSYTDPTSSITVFAGQVLALQLNVDFSAKGLTRAGLGNLIVVSGELEGATVNEVLELANRVLGGGTLPWGLSISELNNVVSKINENFDGGSQNNGYLTE